MRIPYRLLLVLLFTLGSYSYSAGQTRPVEMPRWGEEPVLELTAHRGEVVLNGPWQFAPAVGAPEAVSGRGWGMIWVPGTWGKPGKLPGLLARGEGEVWAAFGNGETAARAWLRRPVRIPRTWAGRAVLLDFERVSTDALVRVNGKPCGRIRWPEGTVEITDAVTPGQDAEVIVEVAATADPAEAERLLKQPAARLDVSAGALDTRGITGDVLLLSRPRGPHVADVFVLPSVRKKLLGVRLEVAGIEKAGEATVEARLLDGFGKEVKQFSAPVALRAADSQTVELSWPWRDPDFWDLGQPNLYQMKLRITGAAAGLRDEYHRRFGFRELWVEGRRLMLNGIPFRPRPITAPESEVGGYREAIRAQIETLMRLGFSLQEIRPEDQLVRGSYQGWSQWYELADELGWPVIGKAVSARRSVGGGERKSDYAAETTRELRRSRNHPSILMWVTDGPGGEDPAEEDPKKIGRAAVGAGRDAASVEAVRILTELDPTRPAFSRWGGGIGDLYSARLDLGWTPLQEREEWLGDWAATGDLPLSVSEWGLPHSRSFLRGRGEAEAFRSEPWATEYQAIYLGRRAYELETEAYRREIAARFQAGSDRGSQRYRSWEGNPQLLAGAGMQELRSLFITNTLRAWRAIGLPAGAKPAELETLWTSDPRSVEEFRQGAYQPGTRGAHKPTIRLGDLYPFSPDGGFQPLPATAALAAVNRATLAWIAGPPAAPAAKEHSFRVGESVHKSVVLINDARVLLPFAFDWRVLIGGKQVSIKGGNGRLRPGQTLVVPLDFTLPATLPGGAADGSLVFRGQIGPNPHTDTFRFRVYGKAAPVKGTAQLFDPAGKTTKLLNGLGLTATPWNGKPGSGLLVIGRDALSAGKPLPGSLEAYARAGGRVIVMGHSPDFLRSKLGFRVSRHVSRRVFAVSPAHPVTKGLTEADLRDWNGSSTVLPEYQQSPLELRDGKPSGPRWGWHRGNRGAVTSAAIEKPHLSGWRPLLECEFDLAYSPLMELDYGAGRVLLCTLDLEDHAAADPAADRLARQLFTYALRPLPAAREKRVAVVGDSSLLDLLKLRGQKTDALDPAADLNVLAPGARVDPAALTAYLEKGGKVLALARRGGAGLPGIGVREDPAFNGALQVPSWPEAAGLSPSDLRARAAFPAELVDTGVEVGAGGLLGRKVVGKGVLVTCQIDPDRLDANRNSYLRFTRWRYTRAVAQLLANLGGSFEADRNVFPGGAGLAPFYHPDYRSDFALGDDPYRYARP